LRVNLNVKGKGRERMKKGRRKAALFMFDDAGFLVGK
jgi:hypothetical protein